MHPRRVLAFVALAGGALLLAIAAEATESSAQRAHASVDAVGLEVARILDEVTSPGGDARQALIALGAPAIPRLLEELAARDGLALDVALGVLAEAPPSKAIGDAVAARVAALLDAPAPGWRTGQAVGQGMRILALNKHPSAVAMARRILRAPAFASARDAARRALVADGSEDAVAVLQEALASARRPPSTSWFRPPSAHGIPELVGEVAAMKARWEANEAPMDGDDLSWAQSDASRERYREHDLLRTADRAAIARAADGREMLVFPSDAMGGWSDEWVVELKDGRPRGPARLVPLPAPDDWGDFCINCPYVFGRTRLDAHIEGDELVMSHGGQPETRQRLSDAWRDTDQDGLTDLVELRLRLNPSDRDTDGDGIADAMDPAPNATRRVPLGEDDAIALAIVSQARVEGDREDGEMLEPRVVVRDVGLEWTGVDALTLTFPAREARDFVDASDLNIEEWTILPAESPRVLGERGDGLTPDRRIRNLKVARGGSSITYEIVVRKLGGEWYVEREGAVLFSCGKRLR